MILCGGSDSGEQKSPEHNFKYLYWQITKIILSNLFTCKGTYTIDWVGGGAGRCLSTDSTQFARSFENPPGEAFRDRGVAD